MRAPIALALSVLATAPALGADFPVLRGSFAPPSSAPRADDDDQTQWAGFYVGGLATYSSSNFRNSGWPAQLEPGFRYQTPDGTPPTSPAGVLLGSARRGGFGGFVGYNMVFGDAMIGVEADLVRSSLSSNGTQTYIPASADPGSRLGYALGSLNSATVSGATKLDAYGSIRARVGWAYGNFLPFITGGLAIGKGSYNTVLTAEVAGIPPTTVVAGVAQKKDVYLYGGTLGAGIDVLLASNILLRAEYQYTKFDGSSIPVAINTVRVGAGVKF